MPTLGAIEVGKFKVTFMQNLWKVYYYYYEGDIQVGVNWLTYFFSLIGPTNEQILHFVSPYVLNNCEDKNCKPMVHVTTHS